MTENMIQVSTAANSINKADLWRAGKMIGGDPSEVSQDLLEEIERIEKALSDIHKKMKKQIKHSRSCGDNWEANFLDGYRKQINRLKKSIPLVRGK